MKTNLSAIICLCFLLLPRVESIGQINFLQDYSNYNSAPIGTFQGINFREAGFSGLYLIPNTNGKEYWTVSDRGANVDAANANPSACRPTYDKIYSFPNYVPKIHRIRVNGDSIQILQTIPMRRPDNTNVSGVLNPAGFGSTEAEVASTDTVTDCANFNSKITAKDVWGIDSEGIVVDKDGNFWICDEGGPTVWKLNKNGVVIARFTPYANQPGAQPQDIAIDTVFKYRKNNRGFEGISITPNGKIYAIIQSPILYPNKSTGEGTAIHRILEINPADNSTRMFAYLNDGIIGSGSNQIRLRDWKIGDMTAINNNEFLVLESAARGTSDIKKIYHINITAATDVHSGFYSGKTLEGLVDAAGLAANGITPVTKSFFMDLLANGWPAALDKAEGLAIINDSTIAVGNDNDYGQVSPLENGIATATGKVSHVITFRLSGANKISNYEISDPTLAQGQTGPSSSKSPYLLPTIPDANFTSILTAGDVVNGYKMVGVPDGAGAFDNGDNTFSFLINHELQPTAGAVRAHGSAGAFVSKWIVNKSDLSVVSGSDLITNVYTWNVAANAYVNGTTAFSRFCSADLPAATALYNSATGLGTQEKIFLNGEETGSEGRAFGHIATGPNAGTTYELPHLGKMSFENSLANPSSGNKTIVASTDDATPGQVYFYVGTKTNTGTEVDKAGLTNGKLYGVAVNGLISETSTGVPAPGTAFSLINLGSVENMSGTTLNTNSNTAGVTTFLRPEDGAWNPANPNDFYFVTTNSITGPSRLWRLHLTDRFNPELGGTIEAVLEGTEGQLMLDNMTIDNSGHVLMQEDVGNNVHIGKIWQYTIATDSLKQVAEHDSNRFIAGNSNYLTQDEEASGIIDAQAILGAGMFLLVDQTHYAIPGEVVEGGQLLAYFNPATFDENPEISLTGNGINITSGDLTPSTSDNTDFGTVNNGTVLTKFFAIQNTGSGNLTITDINLAGSNKFTLVYAQPYPLVIAPGATDTISIRFAPTANGVYNAVLTLSGTDIDENEFTFAIQGKSIQYCTSSGTILREFYDKRNANNVANFPTVVVSKNPAFTEQLTSFEIKINKADKYIDKIKGYVCAPETGEYVFYIASNEMGALYLSSDANPANKVLIASNYTKTAYREWNAQPSQTSVPVTLIQGQKYYVESVHYEYIATDHLSVGWKLPSGILERPIQGANLSPFVKPLAVRVSPEEEILFEESEEVAFYPNPANNVLNIALMSDTEEQIEITISDMKSTKALSAKRQIVEGANQLILDISSLQAGVYVVQFTYSGGNVEEKVVVLH